MREALVTDCQHHEVLAMPAQLGYDTPAKFRSNGAAAVDDDAQVARSDAARFGVVFGWRRSLGRPILVGRRPAEPARWRILWSRRLAAVGYNRPQVKAPSNSTFC